MPLPSQIYIDDSGRIHVSLQCEVCSEWVHTDDHCGDTKPDGTDEYMCSDCYCHKRQGTVCSICNALRPTVDGRYNLQHEWACSDCYGKRAVDPTIPELSEEMCTTFLRESGFKVEKIEGFDLDDEHCRKMEARETLDEMYIHDWLIYPDNPIGCPIAIHKDVMNLKSAKHADCSSPDPDDSIARFGPGSLTLSMTSIDDLHMDVHHVHTLWDEGYLNDKAHLIFKAQGGAA